jgi:chemotaxis protein MotA
MDPAVLVGIVLAFVGILGGNMMEGGSPTAMLAIPPMLIVFGGTFGAAIAGGTMNDAKAIFPNIMRAIMAKPASSADVVPLVVSFAEKARREGLLALEDPLRECDDEFLKKGLTLAVDGTDPDELAEILEAELRAKKGADKHGAKIFEDMGGYAPTVGIIGTVLGLVLVLEDLSRPEELGHLIAGAFLATLWGVLSANVMWLPIANRLKRISMLEAARMELVIEGVLAIQSGSNPRIVAQKLSSLLPAHERESKQKEAA